MQADNQVADFVCGCGVAFSSGLSLRIRDIASYAEAVASQPALDPAEASRILIRALTRVPKGIEETEAQPSKAGVQAQLRSAREDIVSQEKSLLNDILEMLKEVLACGGSWLPSLVLASLGHCLCLCRSALGYLRLNCWKIRSATWMTSFCW